MSTTYNFTHTVSKPSAFANYLSVNYPEEYPEIIDISTSGGNQIAITTVSALDGTQQSALSTLIDNYTDPSVYLSLAYTESLTGVSQMSCSLTPIDVQSLIFPNKDNIDDGTVIDGIKSIIKISTNDISLFAGQTTGSTTFSIYNYTRDLTHTTIVMNLDDVVQAWATRAANNETGPDTVYRTIQFTGLMNCSVNYDCIWVFKAHVSNENITVRMNGIQKLHYIVE